MSFISGHPLRFVLLTLGVLLIAERAYHYVENFGVLREIRIKHPGTCKVLEGDYNGAEDLVALPTGEVLATTGGLDTLKNEFPHLYHGDKLILIDGLKISNIRLENFDADFVPHGVGIKQVDNSNYLVFVINHRKDDDYVEMFTWDRSSEDGLSMTHYNAVSAKQMGIWGNMNDVAIVSKTSFYVTNDKFVGSKIGRISHYLGLPVCKFVFWKDGKAVDISRGYIEPNGVAISPKGDRVFMNDVMSNTFYEFEGDVENGNINLVRQVPLRTGADNIEVISDNELLIGGHPILHQLFIYFRDPEKYKAPSQIIRLKRKTRDHEWEISDLFTDDGSLLNGASVGVYGKGRLYIGSVIDKIAYCEGGNQQ